MKIPYVNFKTRQGDTNAVGGCTFIGGDWKEVDTTEIFDNKKVVVFALPGAFTPTCSSEQLPGYEEKYDELKKYVDEIYCLSVNDSFVMNAWFRDQNITKVKPIGDGTGIFTKGMDMLVNKDHLGFGMRSWRYSAHIINGEVKRMFIEPGKTDDTPEDPYGISSPENVLKYLQGK